MSTVLVPDIIPEIKTWLESNWQKITSFWLHAEWRAWARYDLYAHLVQGMCKQVREDHPRWDYSVSHSVPVWEEDEPEVDLTITPAASQKMNDVAVWICTATPGENDTSFADFVDKFQREWKVLQELVKTKGGGDVAGGKLLFLGLGEKPYEGEDLDFGDLRPQYLSFGGRTEYEHGLYAYYLWLDMPECLE